MYPLEYDPVRDPYPATTTCSSFTVIGGDNKFISYYRNIISMGNTLNRLNEDGNLMINIDLKELQTDIKNSLLKSNKQSQISLNVKVMPLLERDAGYCESRLTIISVQ